jgi:hypothetical protein
MAIYGKNEKPASRQQMKQIIDLSVDPENS